MARVVALDRDTGETFTLDIGDDNPVAVYVPGLLAHGFEALTDVLFLYHVTEEYDPADPTSTACRGTTRASSTSGARDRRSCRIGTPPPRPDHGRRRAARSARWPRSSRRRTT